MDIDPTAMNDSDFDASPATPGQARAGGDECDCIGYECADPALHAPYWAEAADECELARSLR